MTVIPVTQKELRLLVQPFSSDYSALSFVMDNAHKEELARYDRATDTLYINGVLLAQAPVWAVYFCVYKALRYAHQCHCPQEFEPDVQRSLPYAVLGVGKAAKWTGQRWQECRIEGDVDYCESAMRSLPYERECVEYATYEAYDMLSWDLDRDNLHLLAQLHAPRKPLSEQALGSLYAQIDLASK